MAQNPYPLFAIAQNDKPEWVEIRTGMLIRLYLIDNRQSIAQAVVEHINALLVHPGYIKNFEQRCSYLRLAAHWRCLAWIYS